MSPLFEARGLTRTVAGRRLYEGLALELRAGEVIGLRGPSGIGKTQLLRQLARLDPPEGARLCFDGRASEDVPAPAWRAELAYVIQGAPVLRGTPAALALAVAGLRAQRGRGTASQGEHVDLAREWGLAPGAWEQPWSELSLGERQRAQLAIAIARAPRLLLLDEPTSALDPAATAAVEKSLRGRAAVWVTHDPAQTARVATRTLELGA